MTFKCFAALAGAFVLLPTLASAQQPRPSTPQAQAAPSQQAPQGGDQPDDPRIPHFAMAFEIQRVMKQCRIANLPVPAATLDQKVNQLATAIGAATAKEVRDEVSKEPVECPKAGEETEGFKSMLTLVATKSSEEVAQALDSDESDNGQGGGQGGAGAPPAAGQPPAQQPRQ
jgi:hypothetical protein